jgi:chromosome segregation ATPase
MHQCLQGGEFQRLRRPAAHRNVRAMEAHIASLEKAVADAEALAEQRRQQAERVGKRVEPLEANVAALGEAVIRAEARGEQWRQDAETAAKRADALVAELLEITSELIEMSKRMAEQMAATDKVRTEFDDFSVAVAVVATLDGRVTNRIDAEVRKFRTREVVTSIRHLDAIVKWRKRHGCSSANTRMLNASTLKNRAETPPR